MKSHTSVQVNLPLYNTPLLFTEHAQTGTGARRSTREKFSIKIACMHRTVPRPSGLKIQSTKMKVCTLLTASLLLSVSCSFQFTNAAPFTASALQKANPDMNLLNPLSGLSPDPSIQLTAAAEKLPGCTAIGQYEEPQPSVRTAWVVFKGHMDNYIDFHHHQLQKLKSGDSSIRTLTWSCHDPVECCGIGDQLYIIQQALVYAVISNRVLSLHWNQASYETMKYLKPNKIDWTYFNRSQGMKDLHGRDQYRVGMSRTVEYYEPFYEQLMGEDRVHLTVNHELQVPFIRGIRMAAESVALNGTLAQFGITTLLIQNSTRMPLEVFSGELLRYLFLFDSRVVEKVDSIQRQLGLSNKPYLAVHIRTGFLGMEQDEGRRRFNSRKAFRNSTDWVKTIACSIRRANHLYGPETPIYLATDSNLVKKLALSKYGRQRVKMVNLTLQHAALTTPKLTKYIKGIVEPSTKFPEVKGSDDSSTTDLLRVGGVDGYMSTWVDFLLMARAGALVHSISGFSVTAGQFCSTRNQYRLPYCTLNSSFRRH